MRHLVTMILLLTATFAGLRWLMQAEPALAVPETVAATGSEAAGPVSRGRPRADLPRPAGDPAGSGAAESGEILPLRATDLAHVHEVPFDDGRFAALEVGDRLRVEFPPLGGRYDLKVAEVEETASGRTIRGHIEYDARSYPGLITSSAGWSFGTLTTPEGSIEFAARGGRLRTVDGEELNRRSRVADHTLVPPRS